MGPDGPVLEGEEKEEDPVTEGEEKVQDHIVKDLKDIEIDRLKEVISDQELTIKTLRLELFREKDINNALLERDKLRAQSQILCNGGSLNCSINSPESPYITPAQRQQSNLNHSDCSIEEHVVPCDSIWTLSPKSLQLSSNTDKNIDVERPTTVQREVIVSNVNCGAAPAAERAVTSLVSSAVTSTICSNITSTVSSNITSTVSSNFTSTVSSMASNPQSLSSATVNQEAEDNVQHHEFAQIHGRDFSHSKKLQYILKSLRNVPDHRSTLLLGDSNFHCLNKGELDPVKQSMAVRSVGGLCVVATAHALKHFKYNHPRFKKVLFSLGVNDILHREIHCPDDWEYHLVNLLEEAHRVFPHAQIHFLLPFRGIEAVPNHFIEHMDGIIKSHCPYVRRHNAPNMRGKLDRKGIHINNQGAHVLRTFLGKLLVGPSYGKDDSKPPIVNCDNAESYKPQPEPGPDVDRTHIHGYRQVDHVQRVEARPYPVYHTYPPPHPMMYGNHHPVPPYLPPTGFRGQMLREISDAVAAVVFGQMHSEQTNQHNV